MNNNYVVTEERRFRDKVLETSLALWNSLLTVNGILLTVFSVLPSIVPRINKISCLWLIGACSLSLLLLTWNFLKSKALYQYIGKMLCRNIENVSDEKKKENIDYWKKAHRLIILREWLVLALLAVEVLVIWIIAIDALVT